MRFHFEKKDKNNWELTRLYDTKVFVYTSFRKLWGKLERIMREEKIIKADIEIINKEGE